MFALDAAQIDGDFLLEICVPWLTAIMPQQHVFGGNCRIGFELKDPMPVAALAFKQRACRMSDCRLGIDRS